jgi:YD repeat-containing protein
MAMQTAFDHDKDNQVVQKTFAEGKLVSFNYDQAGRDVGFANARNQSVSCWLDVGSQPLQILHSMDIQAFASPVMFQCMALIRQPALGAPVDRSARRRRYQGGMTL